MFLKNSVGGGGRQARPVCGAVLLRLPLCDQVPCGADEIWQAVSQSGPQRFATRVKAKTHGRLSPMRANKQSLNLALKKRKFKSRRTSAPASLFTAWHPTAA